MIKLEDIQAGDIIIVIQVDVARELSGLAREHSRVVERIDVVNGFVTLASNSSMVYGQTFFIEGDNLLTNGSSTYRIIRHVPQYAAIQAVA